MKRILVVLLSLALLLACVPTPEQEFVVNKADGVLTERIAASPAEEKRFEAPAHVEKTVEANGFTVKIAAAVELPGGDRYPVAEVVPKSYDADWARDMLNRIADGKQLLIRESEAGANMTREGILREIQWLQEDITNLDEHYDTLSEAEKVEKRAELNEALEAWEAYYREAPENTDHMDADLSDAAYRATGKMSAEIDCGRTNRTHHSTIDASADGHVQFANMDDVLLFSRAYSPVEGPLRGVTMTEAEAVKTASAFLAKLGETELKPVLVLAADCPRGGDESHDEQAYAIWFTRPVEGMPGAYADSQQDVYGQYSQNGGDRAYSAPCGQEYAYFLVRDTGVNWFDWYNPSTVTRTVNENVLLVPFDTVLDAFKKQIRLEVFPALEEKRAISGVTISDTTLCIDRIALEIVRVRKQNTSETYLLLPVWTFYGTLVLHGENLQNLAFSRGWSVTETGEAVYAVPGACYLQINAIDGSVINPALGY